MTYRVQYRYASPGTTAAPISTDPAKVTRLTAAKRVGFVQNPLNQSLTGLIARIRHASGQPHLEQVLIVGVAVLGLGIAWLAHRRLGDAWGAVTCGVTGLLVTPIAWTHHWVWCVPIALLLWQRARVWSLIALPFWSYVVREVPARHALHLDRLQQLISGTYVYVGVVFLALTAVRALRAPTAASSQPLPADSTVPSGGRRG